MKVVYSLLFGALLAFLAWPYVRIYQLDDTLGKEDLQALAPLIDVPAIRAGMNRQLESQIRGTTGTPAEGSILEWVQDGIQRMGREAYAEVIDLEWVRDTLRASARETLTEPPYYFMRAIDHAFFDGFDSFVIRLGPLDQRPTYVRMQLRNGNWRVTGIYN